MTPEMKTAIATLYLLAGNDVTRPDFNTPAYWREVREARRDFDRKVAEAYRQICEKRGYP
jgi:hypothetical protein